MKRRRNLRFVARPEVGQKQGFVAHSEADPSAVIAYEDWLTQWQDIPPGRY